MTHRSKAWEISSSTTDLELLTVCQSDHGIAVDLGIGRGPSFGTECGRGCCIDERARRGKDSAKGCGVDYFIHGDWLSARIGLFSVGDTHGHGRTRVSAFGSFRGSMHLRVCRAHFLNRIRRDGLALGAFGGFAREIDPG